MSRHVKSRSGCRVCKAKRLKCDETVPACRNCVNRGIACPGYRQVLRWSTKYETGLMTTPETTTGAAANFPQFSQLASAASRSIKRSPRAANAVVKLESPALPAASLHRHHHHDHREPPPEPLPPRDEPFQYKAASELGEPLLFSSPPPSASFSPVSRAAATSTHWATHPNDPTQWQAGAYGTATAAIIPGVGADRISINAANTESVCAGEGTIRREEMDTPDAEAEAEAEAEEEVGSALAPAPAAQAFSLELWQPERMATISVPGGLALPETSLVELWFKSVCGMWAAFDSPANPFRRLCASLWSSNEAVFFAMQTMAAASLPQRPPHIREIIVLAPQLSTQALIHELQDLFRTPIAVGGGGSGVGVGVGAGAGASASSPTAGTASCSALASTELPSGFLRFPAGLLTSLFCMSSSLSWIDARQLGIQYLRNARSVIDLLDTRAALLAPADKELLEFFRGCLLYEEMLRSIVTDDQEDIQALVDWKPGPVPVPQLGGSASASAPGAGSTPLPPEAPSSENGTDDLALHAWAGVPIVLIGLFGKVMALCRRSRRLWRKTAARATYQLLYQAMLDIQEGRALEERLLSIKIAHLYAAENSWADGATRSPCGDESEAQLKTHLYKAAETFRLSSLLQLYQTFPDLASRHQLPPHGSSAGGSGGSGGSGGGGSPVEEAATPMTIKDQPVVAARWLLPLVLHIVDLLAEIPATSPMRCLQPLLCLCAGSALRHDSVGSTVDDGLVFTAANVIDAGDAAHAFAIEAHAATGPPPRAIAPGTVNAARNMVRHRLAVLEQNLPPRPIAVAKKLLETVWATYDKEVAPSKSHWLDIMAETNFESVFG
ncbi:Zn(2)-C6 fungal-type DNA-binding domain protein [Niveomyces insectorum RCEF 264]|uniref:Zn(2)-C6 fungal-type DNA-binding domain protein n=1 Tax=Niveomyces insectorum RCEF 264 TaxID=1081102 RepID=A0A167WYI2_9HYPO|nr:Zn(2)-C6 fungal-type DNA-binding domain protein [Niveomyces insectorum RCEF 264]